MALGLLDTGIMNSHLGTGSGINDGYGNRNRGLYNTLGQSDDVDMNGKRVHSFCLSRLISAIVPRRVSFRMWQAKGFCQVQDANLPA
jgi:hypothetical protein